MGREDKSYLAGTYGGSIGKARVTGYCIKIPTLGFKFAITQPASNLALLLTTAKRMGLLPVTLGRRTLLYAAITKRSVDERSAAAKVSSVA